jgi:hypothetical protein
MADSKRIFELLETALITLFLYFDSRPSSSQAPFLHGNASRKTGVRLVPVIGVHIATSRRGRGARKGDFASAAA